MLGPTPAGKKVWQRLQGHALPLRNLDGMDPIVCGKLIDRPFPTDRLESHFRLERTTVLPSLCRHLLVLPHGSMSLTYSVVQFLGSIILRKLACDRLNGIYLDDGAGVRFTFEFIPIKPSAATGSDVPGNYAGHSRVPSRDNGRPSSTAGSAFSQCDSPSRYC